MNPVVEQNVVTYAAISTAPNPELKLRPGMTANVTVETARRDNVLRVPAAALRFRPDGGVLGALGSKNGETTANQRTPADVNRVWLFDGGLHAVRVRAGVSDGTFTEIVEDELEEGARRNQGRVVRGNIVQPRFGKEPAHELDPTASVLSIVIQPDPPNRLRSAAADGLLPIRGGCDFSRHPFCQPPVLPGVRWPLRPS